MSAAGDAVLAEARRWIGTTEQPPGSNGGPWWDNFGGNYGSWCAAAVSMWVNNALGYGAMCAVDSSAGFMLVSNGSLHSYGTGDGASATGWEAQRTADIEPGTVVLYSWEAWRWEGTPGQGGYPVCDGGSYDGWAAGDHTGVAASTVDGDGWFRAVEGNTSDTDSGSQDDGGGVFEKWRHVSQVCGWWRPVAYGAGGGAGSEEDFLVALTPTQQQDIYNNAARTQQIVERINTDYYIGSTGDPNLLRSMQQQLYDLQAQVGRLLQVVERVNRDLYGEGWSEDPNLPKGTKARP